MSEKPQQEKQKFLQRIVGGVFLIALAALTIPLLFKPSSNLPSPLIEHDEEEYTEPVSIISNAPTRPQIQLESQAKSEQKPQKKQDVVDESIWNSLEAIHPKTENETTAEQSPSPAEPALPAQPQAPVDNKPIASIALNNSKTGSTPQNTQSPTPAKKAEPTEKKSSVSNKVTPKAESPPKKAATQPTSKPVAPKLELMSSSQSQQTTPAKTAQPKSTPTQVAQSGSWYVQVGAFGKRENANRTLNTYKGQGYAVRIKTEGNIHKVQVGPYPSKNDASTIMTRFKNSGINAAVVNAP